MHRKNLSPSLTIPEPSSRRHFTTISKLLSLGALLTIAACGGESTLRQGFGPPKVVSVRLEPESAHLIPGDTTQFLATTTFDDGTSVTGSVSFVATGGHISKEGLFVAGESTGNFLVVAVTGGTADTSRVFIESPADSPDGGGDSPGGEGPGTTPPPPPPTDTAPPPPPPPGSDIQLDFDDLNSLGITCGGGACPFPGGTYRKHSYTASGGGGGTGAINMHWQTGMAIGTSPVWVHAALGRHFKLRYAVKQTAPMVHQGSAIKLLRIMSGANRIGTLESKQGRFSWYWDDWYEGTAASASDLGLQVFADGQWHIYEIELDFRNASQLVARFTFDGTLVSTLTKSASTNYVTGPLIISPFAETYSCGPPGCSSTINTGDYTVDDFGLTFLP